MNGLTARDTKNWCRIVSRLRFALKIVVFVENDVNSFKYNDLSTFFL